MSSSPPAAGDMAGSAASVEKLRAALRPFAEFYDLCERNGYLPVVLWAFPPDRLPFGAGSIGSAFGSDDLRRARDALADEAGARASVTGAGGEPADDADASAHRLAETLRDYT